MAYEGSWKRDLLSREKTMNGGQSKDDSDIGISRPKSADKNLI